MFTFEMLFDYGHSRMDEKKKLEITQKVQVKASLDNNDVEKGKCTTKDVW